MSLIKKNIDLFEFHSNLGLRKQRGQEPQVKFFPAHLKRHGFYDLVKPQKIFPLKPREYRMHFDKDSGILNSEEVIEFAEAQAEMLKKELDTESFKLIIGGDCSILLGNAVALKKKGSFGLFYLDGHTDYADGKLSETKAVAGMDLALATGFGPAQLTNIGDLSPYFEEKNVYCAGDKESDPMYTQLIRQTQIHYYPLDKLRETGCAATAYAFLSHVENQQLDGFFIHFDVDVLTESLMPAVDSPGVPGLNYAELMEILRVLLASPKAVGMEITIFDPSLDKDGRIIERFIQELTPLFDRNKA